MKRTKLLVVLIRFFFLSTLIFHSPIHLSLSNLQKKRKKDPFFIYLCFISKLVNHFTHFTGTISISSSSSSLSLSLSPRIMNLQPEQQQQAGPGEVQIPAMSTTPEAVPAPAGAWQSSGSVGPFFAVISVLTVLSVLSCYLGRKWNPRPLTPLESIENESRSCFGWLKLFRRPFIPSPVQVKNVNKSPETLPASANNKHSDDDCKVEEGEVISAQNGHSEV